MALIVDALKRAARQCSVDEPSSWLTATDTDQVELRDDFLLETVQDIADRVDLPAPISASTTITGDGTATYALPANFVRVHRDSMAVYENTAQRRALTPVTNDGLWTHIETIGTTGAERFYKVTGYDGNFTLNVQDEPASTITIIVHYVTNLWMATSGGTAGSAFTDADDVLLMPRRIVEVGIVWRFRERNGLPASSKRTEYEMLLARLSSDSRGRRAINFAGGGDARHPWEIPVPNYIPPAP